MYLVDNILKIINSSIPTGASISPEGGIRGNGVTFFGGSILLDSPTFKPKPSRSVTIALWIKMNVAAGRNTLFATIGKSGGENGFKLSVNDGKIGWSYAVDDGQRLFQLESGPMITPHKWFHIAVTADNDIGEARIFVNGGLQSIGVSRGKFSPDWSVKAGFGVQETLEGKSLQAIMDEVYLYSSALRKDEILRYIRQFKEMRFLMTPSPVTMPTVTRHLATITTTTKQPPTTTTTTTTAATTTTTTSTTTPATTNTVTITKPLQQSSCKFGNVYEYTDLKGGLGAGNFLDRGLTPNVQVCMELCCAHKTCDLAYVVSSRCYLVECYTLDLCSVVPKEAGSVAPVIGMINRPGGPKSKFLLWLCVVFIQNKLVLLLSTINILDFFDLSCF